MTDQCEYASILQECIDTGNQREKSYGGVVENFVEISKIHQAMFGAGFFPSDICKVLISVKVARQKFKCKRDNIIDNINYNAILSVLLAHEEQTNRKSMTKKEKQRWIEKFSQIKAQNPKLSQNDLQEMCLRIIPFRKDYSGKKSFFKEEYDLLGDYLMELNKIKN